MHAATVASARQRPACGGRRSALAVERTGLAAEAEAAAEAAAIAAAEARTR